MPLLRRPPRRKKQQLDDEAAEITSLPPSELLVAENEANSHPNAECC